MPDVEQQTAEVPPSGPEAYETLSAGTPTGSGQVGSRRASSPAARSPPRAGLSHAGRCCSTCNSSAPRSASLQWPGPRGDVGGVSGPSSGRQVSENAETVDITGGDAELCDHTHHSNRTPWLRALVLGASDGLVSTAALMVGVAGGTQSLTTLRLAGVAGLVGGALSMAVGEYISVASQRDAEHADIEKERLEQLKGPEARAHELEELSLIYVERGLPYDLAKQVAVVLTEKDVIRAHARDELGIDIDELANPLQAAIVSCICFSVGGGLPLVSSVFITPYGIRLAVLLITTSIGLVFFGVLGAWLGGANIYRGGLRVIVGGWIALAVVYGIGRAFNVPAV